MGKCPACTKVITNLTLHPVSARGGPITWNALLYLCPHCHTILSAGLDLTDLKTDMIKAILEQLGN